MDLQRSDQADISQFYNGYTRTASDLQGIIQYYCTTVFYNTASHITKGEGCTKHPHEIHNTFTTSVVFCNTKLETTGEVAGDADRMEGLVGHWRACPADRRIAHAMVSPSTQAVS